MNDLGGYSGSREQNYEIKYLRKALGRVDSRIRVPESVRGEALRHLLDEVERPSPLETATRARPRWLSLQSGVAYAAAFVLIVALFYSSRLYSPDIVSGGMLIDQLQGSGTEETTSGDVPFVGAAETELPVEIEAFALPEDAEQDSGAQSTDARTDSEADTVTPPSDARHAVGGSGMATLLLEQDQTAYYWRLNDATDPDKAGFPCTVEVIDTVSGTLITQIDYENIQSIAEGFLLDDRLVIIGTAASSADLIIYVYDASDPLNPVQMSGWLQSGTFVDANVYKGFVRVATVSNEPFGDEVEELPNSGGAQQYCVLSVINPVEYKLYAKSYLGANGTVQLYNLNAYIYYTGVDDNGAEKDYVAQIDFDDLYAGLDSVR